MVERMIMRLGSSGPFVRDLQLALNARMMPSPNLATRGIFDAHTQAAVTAFQEANWLCPDGHCDQATVDCLYGGEAHLPIQHNLRYLPQQNPQSGWATMVAMLRRTSVGAAVAAMPRDLLSPAGDLVTPTKSEQVLELRHRFARAQQLTFHPPHGLVVSRLIEALRKGPVGLERLVQHQGVSIGAASRFLVLAAARGTHGADGATSTLRIYDPDPTRRGGIYSQTFASLVRSQQGTRLAMFTS